MLRVTVELLRGGTGDPEVVGTAEVANLLTGPDRPRLGDYRARFSGRGVEAEARVEGFPREELSAWHLLGRALAEAGLVEQHERLRVQAARLAAVVDQVLGEGAAEAVASGDPEAADAGA